jgi:hypothetical protein
LYWRSRFVKSDVNVRQMKITIADVVKNPRANMFFSFVIGVGLSILLFHRNRSEYVIPAVPADQLVNSINKVNGKCYRYRITDASEPSR